MSFVTLGSVYGATLTAELDDGTQRVIALELDARNATRAVHVLYPEDGSKVDAVAQPGQLLTRTFVGSNRLQKLTQQRTRPGDGATIQVWTEPTYRLEGGQ